MKDLFYATPKARWQWNCHFTQLQAFSDSQQLYEDVAYGIIWILLKHANIDIIILTFFVPYFGNDLAFASVGPAV